MTASSGGAFRRSAYSLPTLVNCLVTSRGVSGEKELFLLHLHVYHSVERHVCAGREG